MTRRGETRPAPAPIETLEPALPGLMGPGRELWTAERTVEGEIGVSFVSEEVIRELNRRYLGRTESTDVIAFQLGEAEELLGDIYIAPEVAARTAVELGIPEEEELVRLLVHGVLHVLGHDHPDGEDRYGSAMFRLQEELVERLTGAES